MSCPFQSSYDIYRRVNNLIFNYLILTRPCIESFNHYYLSNAGPKDWPLSLAIDDSATSSPKRISMYPVPHHHWHHISIFLLPSFRDVSIIDALLRVPAVVNIDLRVRHAGLIRPGHKQIRSRLNPAQIVTNSHLNNDHVRGVTVSQNVAN